MLFKMNFLRPLIKLLLHLKLRFSFCCELNAARKVAGLAAINISGEGWYLVSLTAVVSLEDATN